MIPKTSHINRLPLFQRTAWICLIAIFAVFFLIGPAWAAPAWITITSSHYDSHCGNETGRTPQEALDGTDHWAHYVPSPHWLIFDLGQTYTVEQVRGRSSSDSDPTDVDIYVSDVKGSWGTAVATGITQ